ncbi:hypothetical protein NDU88_003436, partial [Pleurodeles waltl]
NVPPPSLTDRPASLRGPLLQLQRHLQQLLLGGDRFTERRDPAETPGAGTTSLLKASSSNNKETRSAASAPVLTPGDSVLARRDPVETPGNGTSCPLRESAHHTEETRPAASAPSSTAGDRAYARRDPTETTGTSFPLRESARRLPLPHGGRNWHEPAQ